MPVRCIKPRQTGKQSDGPSERATSHSSKLNAIAASSLLWQYCSTAKWHEYFYLFFLIEVTPHASGTIRRLPSILAARPLLIDRSWDLGKKNKTNGASCVQKAKWRVRFFAPKWLHLHLHLRSRTEGENSYSTECMCVLPSSLGKLIESILCLAAASPAEDTIASLGKFVI